MRLIKTFAFVTLATFATVACGKGPAQTAITAADAAVESARPEGEKYVPEQFKALADAAAAAKAKFDGGDYKAALEGAQAIPAQATNVIQAASAKKTELMDSWKAMESSLPTMVADIQKKVMELTAARKLPAGMDKAMVAEAQTTLDGVTAAWTEASASFASGDVMAAAAKAAQVKTTAEGLMTTLGMTPAPVEAAAAPAATPAQ